MHQKAKGNSFERKTANMISLLLTDNKETHAVWRTHSSGAIYTINAKTDKKYIGDLYRVVDKGLYPLLDTFFDEFIIECKHYDDLSFKPPFRKVFLTNIIYPTFYKEKDKYSVLLIIGGGGKPPVYFIEKDYGDWNVALRFDMSEFNVDEVVMYGYEEKKINKMFGNILGVKI